MSAAAPAPAQPALTLDNASQAKSLDDIENIAAGLDGAAGAPGAAPLADAGPPLNERNAKIIKDLACLFRDATSEILELKAPRAVATDAAIGGLAAGWGEWSAKRSYDLQALMGDHGDTIPLAIATAALAWAVFSATKAELSTRRPVDVKAKPASDTITVPPGAQNESGVIKPGFGS